MVEKERILRAKMYVDKLANGINPLTDQPLPDEDPINNVKISRCFFYVSDLLRRLVENGGLVQEEASERKLPFRLDFADRQRFRFSETPISISEIAKRINELIDPNTMSKLSYRDLVDWLLEVGQLSMTTAPDGTTHKLPTPSGTDRGIILEQRQGQRGPYTVIVYNREAQQFILDNLDGAIAWSRHAREGADLQLRGRPWTQDHEEILVDLFRKQVPIQEIAVTLKRTENGVRSKLKKLGLLHSGNRT